MTVPQPPVRNRAALRRAAVALPLACTLSLGAVACGGSKKDEGQASASPAGSPSPTSSVEKQKFAKTRFVTNAGLAAGATYQWIIKPYKAGGFQKGADHRKTTLVKAGLAGVFTYNRLKAAVRNAQGDPTLSKALAPLNSGIDSLKNLGTKLRKGEAGPGDVDQFQNVINNVKDVGKKNGAEVTNQVPSASQLSGG
ncbi:hypothetical protein ACFU90_38455 [Streptomyces noursei]|uniref:Uncharacterized protein n=1 Tax=Streptomyces noursei TaxID=1971 RepID=A0A059W6B0_STRNR|nr:hypothetical protein [Streptomyces noursei]AKA03674.1 hypothetical protein SAZ_15360 [Streptomyces noursei ZPM]AIA03296.1 hypothetical protein DC74_2796 [Streptomyces noursei]EOT04161.1 hypothetical protein K530_10018 [Streptomyces noursei CCRC 11814]EXU87137.1 hypothetical protein P354_37690 [Streptomyces noursei PD-1]MCE4948915.1 hypothetical protein [Streptomyces noursei]